MTYEWIVDVQNVTKKYDDKVALDSLSIKIAPERTIALIGPNGAGKTTFLEILLGLRQPDSGSVFVLGQDIIKDPRSHVDRLGVQLQETRLFTKARPREYFVFFAKLFSQSVDIDILSKQLEIDSFLDTELGKLSGGQRQRVALGLALINNPDLVILDEPTVGLDPIARREFWSLINQLREEGKTLLFSTHYMEEAEALADEIMMISNGRLVASGKTETVIENARAFGCNNLDDAYRYYASNGRRQEMNI
jgi:ABC-2 type transport system ATP-binding protein